MAIFLDDHKEADTRTYNTEETKRKYRLEKISKTDERAKFIFTYS